MAHLQTQYVTASELRERFNAGGHLQRYLNGEYRTRILANKHPSAPKANEPVCTRSQILKLYTQHGVMVAIVHRYLRTDGTLGASGRPDPKQLRVGAILYIAA